MYMSAARKSEWASPPPPSFDATCLILLCFINSTFLNLTVVLAYECEDF